MLGVVKNNLCICSVEKSESFCCYLCESVTTHYHLSTIIYHLFFRENAAMTKEHN
jgi:hypothetical protein